MRIRSTNDPPTPMKVLIAGGGVAAVELALALHDLAGDRVQLAMVTPASEFALRPLATAEPFSADHVRRHSLRELAERVDAELVADAVTAVNADSKMVRLASTAATIDYDALVIAVGARQRTAYPRALTFAGDSTTTSYNGLLADLEGHWSRSVAFVVPPGTTWPLPLYELALMTAREVAEMGIDDVKLQLVTPEARPLGLFGRHAADAVARLLDRAGVAFRGSTYARAGSDGRLDLLPTGEPLDAERVVALPTIEGPQLLGLPSDERGFIPVDEHGRVAGLRDVYAAGDATTFPVKQGGLACQQADAIAELLAATAGANVKVAPFRPVLRGRLLTGRGAQYLEHAVRGGAGDGSTAALHLWSAPHKIDGRYLSPWLQELETGLVPAPAATTEDHIDVEVALPSPYEIGRKAMRLAPYAPLSQS